MTDTEAKALALVNEVRRQAHIPTTVYHEAKNLYGSCWEALCRVIEAQEATEARHAAEMRELKERFSEVAGRAVKHMARTCFAKGSPCQLEREAVVEGLTDFIIPAPDPLVEAIRSAMPKALVAHDTYDAIVMDVAAAVRKIGEAGE